MTADPFAHQHLHFTDPASWEERKGIFEPFQAS
jgi:hypothetical protein